MSSDRLSAEVWVKERLKVPYLREGLFTLAGIYTGTGQIVQEHSL